MIHSSRQASSSLSTLVFWLAALCLSCSAEPGGVVPIGGTSSGGAPSYGGTATGGSPDAGSAGLAVANPLGRARCQPPPGMTGSPHTIEEAVALLSALPKPTSVACFVESLDRPFAAYATSSQVSAQPAFSARSPRVFIKIDRLWLSIVLEGESSYLLELSYLVDELHSVKGELKTPILGPLAPSAPYDRVRQGEGTVCGVCHYGEERAATVTFASAFASTPFRPRPDVHVALDGLAAEARVCDWVGEPRRCEMLSALFDGGAVTEESFPSTMPTFF